MSKYRKPITDEELEKSVKETEQELDGGDPQNQEKVQGDKKSEAESWKKRASDTRSYYQKQLNEANKRIQEYENKLASQPVAPPQSEQELEEWVNKYPVVAGAIETIVGKRVNQAVESLNLKNKDIEDRMQQIKLEEAKAGLRKIHKDFDEVVASKEFTEWLEYDASDIERKIMQDPGPDPDVKAAANVISAFKFNTKWGVLDKDTSNKEDLQKQKERSAASAVTTGSGKPKAKEGVQYKFSESQVQSMSIDDYTKLEDEIKEAIETGEFLYDLSQRPKN